MPRGASSASGGGGGGSRGSGAITRARAVATSLSTIPEWQLSKMNVTFLVFSARRENNQGHRIKIGGLGRMANSAFGGKLNLCGTCSHLCTMFVVYLVVDNKYNVYVR